MKKLLKLLLIFTIVCVFVSCESNSSDKLKLKELILSADTVELTEGESTQLTYTVYPEKASERGLVWKSNDDSIASVDSNGTITANKEGSVVVTLSNSNGVYAHCRVTVNKKILSAYEQLSDKEKAFVDLAIAHLDTFKNPDSVIIKSIGEDSVWEYTVKVSAQNGFGGYSTEIYYLCNPLGFFNWNSLDIDQDIDMESSSLYDVSLINQAIKDRKDLPKSDD